MVIDKEEALDLLTARFDSVNEIPRLSRAEKLAEYNRDRLPKGTFYHVQDKMGVSSYGLIVSRSLKTTQTTIIQLYMLIISVLLMI